MIFSEKGEKIFNWLKDNNYPFNEPFTSKMLSEKMGEKISGNTIAAMNRNGYFIRNDTKPVSYKWSEEDLIKYESNAPKKFLPYSFKEFSEQYNSCNYH